MPQIRHNLVHYIWVHSATISESFVILVLHHGYKQIEQHVLHCVFNAPQRVGVATSVIHYAPKNMVEDLYATSSGTIVTVCVTICYK